MTSSLWDPLPVMDTSVEAWDDLYQDVVIDHARTPRCVGRLDPPAAHAHGENPLCGDCVDVFVQTRDDRVVAVRQNSQGCALSKASASMLAEVLNGRSKDEIDALRRALLQRWQGAAGSTEAPWPLWAQDLAALEGVTRFPGRVKCATMAWHALDRALRESLADSTEACHAPSPH